MSGYQNVYANIIESALESVIDNRGLPGSGMTDRQARDALAALDQLVGDSLLEGEKNVPQDAPVRLETNGANGVWEWQVVIDDQRVLVELTNAELRTVAYRATRNPNKRARLAGLEAWVKDSL